MPLLTTEKTALQGKVDALIAEINAIPVEDVNPLAAQLEKALATIDSLTAEVSYYRTHLDVANAKIEAAKLALA